jgi:hypothetical protein
MDCAYSLQMQHMLKMIGLLILPTQGVSALAGSPAGVPLKSSAGLVWIQRDKPARRQTVELRPLEFFKGFAVSFYYQKPDDRDTLPL